MRPKKGDKVAARKRRAHSEEEGGVSEGWRAGREDLARESEMGRISWSMAAVASEEPQEAGGFEKQEDILAFR